MNEQDILKTILLEFGFKRLDYEKMFDVDDMPSSMRAEYDKAGEVIKWAENKVNELKEICE